MSTSLVPKNSQENKTPVALHPAVQAALSVGLAALADGSLHREVVPAAAVAALQARRRDLAASLNPAPRDAILMTLLTLGNMPSQAVANADEAKAFLRQDLEDLAGLTLWSLQAAAKEFRQGEHGRWRPTAGDLRQRARQHEVEPRAELYRIGKLLDAPSLAAPKPVPISQGRFAELKDKLAKLPKPMLDARGSPLGPMPPPPSLVEPAQAETAP